MKSAVKDGESGLTKESVAERLAGQIYDDAFGESKSHEEYNDLRKRFVDTLGVASNQDSKPRSLWQKFKKIETPYSKAQSDFDSLVVEINNKFCNGIAPDSPHQIKMKDVLDDNRPVATSSQSFFEDFHQYSKDVIEKLLKKDSSKSIEDFLKERASKSKFAKNALATIAFFAVGGFLLGLPKLYQQGKTSPAEQSAKRAEGGADENK